MALGMAGPDMQSVHDVHDEGRGEDHAPQERRVLPSYGDHDAGPHRVPGGGECVRENHRHEGPE